jgi:hypothetical protein
MLAVRMWAGDREFNPLVIVIPERGPVQVIRCWQAFRDYRHGRNRALRAAESELAAPIGVTLRRGRADAEPAYDPSV